MTNATSRPLPENIATPALKEVVLGEGLKIEPSFRADLQRHLAEARQCRDGTGIAFVAFSLAYSYDHYEPYAFEQAVQLLGEALNYFPEWPEAKFNRGVARIHLRKFDEAVQDFEATDRAYFNATTPNVLEAQDANVIKGKLLMFLAEALCGRGQPGDLELARSDLIRAEVYLLRCVDNPQLRGDARFWIDQIPSRLKATLPPAEKLSRGEGVRYPVAFLIGVLAVPFILWWLVATTVPLKGLEKVGDKPGTPNPANGALKKAIIDKAATDKPINLAPKDANDSQPAGQK